MEGTVNNSDTCNDNGECTAKCIANVEGDRCDKCSADYYNFPNCIGR